jgi:quercetin dioxygenase-like cupin family protein
MSIRRKMLLAVAACAAAGVTVASVAFATAPSGQTGQVLDRGTTDVTLNFTVPKTVTVTKKVRVRVKVHGKFKFVTQTKKVQQTIQSPVVACSTSTPCDVVHQKVTFTPGGFSGWHSHPGVVLVVIESGAITRYFADCTHQTFNAGQSFVELGRDQTAFVRNEGSTPAQVMATLIVPAGTSNADLRIDQPQPASCTP